MSPSNPILTILTPTWNRRELLPRLYHSLLEQAVPFGSFCWLVVDDGSTDGTQAWLKEIAQTAPFSIRVVERNNGGKHRAVNQGAKLLTTPWVLINDSDDWIAPTGLTSALEQIQKVDSSMAVNAIIAPRRMIGHQVRRFMVTGRQVSFRDWLYQPRVDTTILMRSTIMQAHPFPEYEAERFIAESSAFSGMFATGGILLTNEIIVEGEYQASGLSAHSVALRARNPFGAMHCYRAHIEAGVGPREHFRSRINYHRFWWHAFLSGRKPFHAGFHVSLIWILPGWIAYLKDQWLLRFHQRTG